MTFVDHDLRKFPKFAIDKYMVVVCETKEGPTHLFPMEWERGLDKVVLLSLMHMPHIGRSVEVNACVKQLLVSFHGGFIWLDKKVLLISSL